MLARFSLMRGSVSLRLRSAGSGPLIRLPPYPSHHEAACAAPYMWSLRFSSPGAARPPSLKPEGSPVDEPRTPSRTSLVASPCPARRLAPRAAQPHAAAFEPSRDPLRGHLPAALPPRGALPHRGLSDACAERVSCRRHPRLGPATQTCHGRPPRMLRSICVDRRSELEGCTRGRVAWYAFDHLVVDGRTSYVFVVVGERAPANRPPRPASRVTPHTELAALSPERRASCPRPAPRRTAGRARARTPA